MVCAGAGLAAEGPVERPDVTHCTGSPWSRYLMVEAAAVHEAVSALITAGLITDAAAQASDQAFADAAALRTRPQTSTS